jgi:hypothetical protein
MTTLTPNRIIEKGDQYLDGEKWKPVPEIDIGLQIQFTDYAQVRRPSEAPPHTTLSPEQYAKLKPASPKPLRETPDTAKESPTEAPKRAVSPDNLQKTLASEQPISPKTTAAVSKLISPDSGERPAAKAESDKTPAASHSAAGDAHSTSYLPTVVSTKAHKLVSEDPEAMTEFHKGLRKTETEKAIEKAKVIGLKTDLLKITWPKNNDCIWTGRNGTFQQYGMEISRMDGTEGKIMLFPIGKRGVGNCTIQFPVSAIPQIVDFLNAQKTPK